MTYDYEQVEQLSCRAKMQERDDRNEKSRVRVLQKKKGEKEKGV